MIAPFDMVSFTLVCVTSMALRRHLRLPSVRMACVVFAVTAPLMRKIMLLESMGVSHEVAEVMAAVLGVLCNLSLAWIMVMEPPVAGRHGAVDKLHRWMHCKACAYADAAAQISSRQPDSVEQAPPIPANLVRSKEPAS